MCTPHIYIYMYYIGTASFRKLRMTSCQNDLLFSFFPLPSTNLRPDKTTNIVGGLWDNKVLIWKIRCQDNFQTAWIIILIPFPRASRKWVPIVYYLVMCVIVLIIYYLDKSKHDTNQSVLRQVYQIHLLRFKLSIFKSFWI